MRERWNLRDWPAGGWLLAWAWLAAPLVETGVRAGPLIHWWSAWTLPAPIDCWGKVFWFVPAMLAMAALYGPLLDRLRRWPRSRVVGLAAVYGLLAVLTPPLLSHDPLTFMAEARILAVHHLNPLTHAVAAVPGWRHDRWLRMAGWRRTVNPYGPYWFLLAGLMGRVAQPFWPLYLGFKSLGVASGLVTTGVLAGIGGDRGGSAARAFWFHPLVGLEILACAQNDAVMLACLVGGFACYRSKQYGAAGLLTGIATGTKAVPLVLIPWLLLGLGPGDSVTLLGGMLLSLAAGYVALWPGVHGLAVPWRNQGLFLRSPAFVIEAVVRRLGGTIGRSREIGAAFAETAFFIWWIDRGRRFFGDAGRDPLWLGDILLGLSLIGLTWFQYWYLVWALPFYLVSRHAEGPRMVRFLAIAELARPLSWISAPRTGGIEAGELALLWVMLAASRRPWAPGERTRRSAETRA